MNDIYATVLHFRGSPRLVEGLAPVPPLEVAAVPVSINLDLPRQKPEPLVVQTAPAGATASRLRFSLPEETPPGTYRGTLQFGGQRYPAVVEVEPHPHLLISPSQLSLQAAPGEEVEIALTIVNDGNVEYEVPRAHGFGLFDVTGVERAIGATLRDSEKNGLERINRLADEVADGHGGLVRVNIKEGAGSIAPGKLSNLRVALRLPKQLKAGQTYSGTWPLLNLRYYVRIYVSNQSTNGEVIR
jgi:hypothetical protein